MPISSSLVANISGDLASAIAKINAYQASYALLNNGRYWQGILTPSIFPSNGSRLLINPSAHPMGGERNEDWSGVSLQTMLPVSVEVHTHDGPNGTGYTIVAWIDESGSIWSKGIGVGQHSLTRDWGNHLVNKLDIPDSGSK